MSLVMFVAKKVISKKNNLQNQKVESFFVVNLAKQFGGTKNLLALSTQIGLMDYLLTGVFYLEIKFQNSALYAKQKIKES